MRAFAADDPERFAKRYGLTGTTAEMATEFETLGSDYQANGYTTMEQADRLRNELELQPGKVLVDLGSGCGWPGLYLAQSAGCAVISIDPVAEGCATANRRLIRDGLVSPSASIRGDAESIPIRPASVDAVTHGDLLC
ncbi:MAG: class I SAM-dependent methyltransferase [Acidimicrobiaceae bacterium]|jgi:ubiquinone/menaquinone biosynthesis C-methylase UbiE|nr:class I SAM-dependent methyltransferase [Acidimicrobiaceae bacterium]MBT5580108.1 class I SAM-dependent methyltransferase [Acidimicrobiaceae bacterium]MBT5850046.1 class I SAM-dependent methyltransferase [Acidimicrobiaceae bacterium]